MLGKKGRPKRGEEMKGTKKKAPGWLRRIPTADLIREFEIRRPSCNKCAVTEDTNYTCLSCFWLTYPCGTDNFKHKEAA